MLSARKDSDSTTTSDINLADEVDFISNDVKFAVEYISVSTKIPESDGRIYINIQTREKDKFCVELSKAGFTVVGCDFDCKKDDEEITGKTYETIYSLLSDISLSYCSTFSAELSRKLSLLNNENQDSTMENK